VRAGRIKKTPRSQWEGRGHEGTGMEGAPRCGRRRYPWAPLARTHPGSWCPAVARGGGAQEIRSHERRCGGGAHLILDPDLGAELQALETTHGCAGAARLGQGVLGRSPRRAEAQRQKSGAAWLKKAQTTCGVDGSCGACARASSSNVPRTSVPPPHGRPCRPGARWARVMDWDRAQTLTSAKLPNGLHRAL